jgi:hypothetical protein
MPVWGAERSCAGFAPAYCYPFGDIEMKTLVRCIDGLSNWASRVSAVVLGLMTILILVEITLWNLLEKTTLIADEYSAYGLAAIIFLGAGYCLKERGHIRITLVLGFLPAKTVTGHRLCCHGHHDRFYGLSMVVSIKNGASNHPLRFNVRDPDQYALMDSTDVYAHRRGLLSASTGRHDH